MGVCFSTNAAWLYSQWYLQGSSVHSKSTSTRRAAESLGCADCISKDSSNFGGCFGVQEENLAIILVKNVLY